VITRMVDRVRRFRPRIVDPMVFCMVSLAFGLGVLFVAHHGKSLRLDVEGASLGWVVLVAFGMAYHGEWRHGWRVGAGLMFGAAAAIATFYGAMSRLPLTPFSMGLGLGLAAACVAVIAHVYPRAISFAGAAVGYGVGIAAARALPIRPVTPADDMWALMLTTSLVIVIGVVASLVLRALVVRMGFERRSNVFVRFVPRRRRSDLEHTAAIDVDAREHAGVGR
jgi:hypothetical protein